MGIVKETLNFERPISAQDVKSKLLGFRKGQIVVRRLKWDAKEDNTYSIYVYIGENPNYLDRKYSIAVYPLGEITEDGMELKNINRRIDSLNLMTMNARLRVLREDEIPTIKSFLLDPKNRDLIKGIEERQKLKISI